MVKLVGILNVTPDSFSDGGKYFGTVKALARADKLFNDGAALIDVGAESTRPGADLLSDEEEWDRLSKLLPRLLQKYPGKISLDSHHPENIRKAYAIGPVIVNDVTGMNTPEMIDVVVQLQANCIISQLPGTDIQLAHQTMPITTIEQVVEDLLTKEAILIEKGLSKNKIVLDPGIGFGKTPELNNQLLEFAKYVPGHKVMIGYSRKRFLGENRMELEPNLEAGRIAVAAGADYLRVHDVAGHKQLLDGIN